MSIAALGGGANPSLQRALMDAAERSLTDELGLLAGEDPAVTSQTAAGASASARRAPVRRRAAGDRPAPSATPRGEALVVEVGERARAERLEVAGGWITTAKRGPLETAGRAQSQRVRREVADRNPDEPLPARPVVPRPGRNVAPAPPSGRPTPAPATEPSSLDRLIVVLKKTGIDFRDAYQVLREIRAGEPLPPRGELRARWVAADPAAWEERARARAAEDTVPAKATVHPAQHAADTDLRRTPIDDLIRDRGWHRANDDASAPGARPTLQTIAQETALHQSYLAALSTAEFQRLVTVLGGSAPEWFWDLRGHRGLRGLAERPTIARLNTTRIAGTRLGAWLLAVLGMALLWYLGVSTGTWW